MFAGCNFHELNRGKKMKCPFYLEISPDYGYCLIRESNLIPSRVCPECPKKPPKQKQLKLFGE